MNSFYFVLGRENKISQKEVESVLANFGVYLSEAKTPRSPVKLGRAKLGEVGSEEDLPYSFSILNDEVLEIKSDFFDDEILKKLIEILGGTIKIFRRVSDKTDQIAEILQSAEEKKLTFGISNYSKKVLNTFHFGLSIKKQFKNKKSLRIIPPKDGDRLSSAQSFQYELDKTGLEFGIFNSGIGQLAAVQNINFWSEIDYGKPRADARAGMLPPKLARAMVNIALGQVSPTKLQIKRNYEITNNPIEFRNSDLEIRNHNNEVVVVDPFCGSGNILMQAVVLGFSVLGVDISGKAVDNSRANLDWLIQKSKIKNPCLAGRQENDNVKFKIIQSDSTKFNFNEIDRDYIIVTEPNLGKPRREKFSQVEAEVEAENISRLYKKFFENLAKTKKQPKVVCMVFPLLEMKNGKKLSIFSRLLDFFENLGYIISYPPLKYGRADQFVKREILLLRQKK